MFDVYHLLNLVLYFELLLFFIGFGAIVIHRIIAYVAKVHKENITTQLSEKLIELIETGGKFTPDHLFCSRFFLEVLEKFDLRFKGKEFDFLKEDIVKYYFQERAQRLAKSFFWTRRNIAARIFALAAFPEDEPLILKLLSDSHFLVRSVAAAAAIHLESEAGIANILRQMNEGKGYTRYFYADLLSTASSKVFSFIIKTGEEFLPASLLALSQKTIALPIPFLEEELNASDPKRRLIALKVLVRNPTEKAEERFSSFLKDPDPLIRSLAAKGLGNLASEQSIQLLVETLKDPVWIVRWEAARSLKKRDQIELLKNQKEDVAAYAIEFG